jgi:hypothetical protein
LSVTPYMAALCEKRKIQDAMTILKFEIATACLYCRLPDKPINPTALMPNELLLFSQIPHFSIKH